MVARRLIPAHAGKTLAPAAPGRAARAHPRSRGENTLIRADDKTFKGSSPLTRGKLDRGGLQTRETRLIPAHAGKTPRFRRRLLRGRAHPRSRGENNEIKDRLNAVAGSSPLTRGKRGGEVGLPIGARLIPAHAGKTHSSEPDLNGGGAHPRSRGENCEELRVEDLRLGSSPLTRGKRR